MATRLRVDTIALRAGALSVGDCSRNVDVAHGSLASCAAPVPDAMSGARTVAAWQAMTHLAIAVGAEAEALAQLSAGLTDVAATIEHREIRLADAALTLAPRQA